MSTQNKLNFWILAGFAATSLVPAGAFAAGFANTNQSATATALGGVGVANPDEANRSYYNPASMTEARLGIYLGDVVVIPTVSYRSADGETTETVQNILPPPNFHFGYAITDDLAAGIGFTMPYGLTMEWPQDWEGREIITKQTLRTFNINPNVAYRFPGTKFSVALGGQIVPADVTLDRKTVLRSDKDVAAELGGTGLGFGATAAAFYRPTSNLTFGATYRSSVKIDFEGDAHFDGEEGTPFETTFVDQAISTELTLPHSATLGVGYQADRVWVGFDVGMTFWNSYDTLELRFSEPCEAGDATCTVGVDATNPPTTVIRGEWKDSPTFRLGFQYDVLDYLALRAGVAWDISPIPDTTVAPSLPGNDRAVLSGGVGYHRKEWRTDLAYQLVKATRNIQNGNQDGRYDTTAHILGLNVGYEY
jgi:long-chain fatty acid transport protein